MGRSHANDWELRYEFFKMQQKPGQSILDFTTKVITHASFCNFGCNLNRAVLDQCVLGMHNLELQGILLSEPALRINK